MDDVRDGQSSGSDFFKGMMDGVPIAVGYMPVALAFGLIAANTGLSILESFLMSFLVFAGAAQYMALSMIAAGSGVIAIIIATFIVNVRHLLMSASIASRLEPSPVVPRVFSAFVMTDEVFAVSSAKKDPLRVMHITGTGLVAFMSWTGFTVVGYLAGGIIPGAIQESLGFALYALFIALLVPSVKETGRSALFLAVLGGVFHLVFAQVLDTGWAIMCASIASVLVFEGIERWIEWRHR